MGSHKSRKKYILCSEVRESSSDVTVVLTGCLCRLCADIHVPPTCGDSVIYNNTQHQVMEYRLHLWATRPVKLRGVHDDHSIRPFESIVRP